ncbi:uncharacterized protein YALI1_B02151g [Yarrowia lipolytica]|uniref:Uncharacterized protein n=1 Tax=Yarrowia lipolytica TaxID=4952 RepID=A0A1D8N611_YARLL|nr:hypothetical protein YALI1_B02151g [Yarrowia lipolytica]
MLILQSAKDEAVVVLQELANSRLLPDSYHVGLRTLELPSCHRRTSFMNLRDGAMRGVKHPTLGLLYGPVSGSYPGSC